MDSPGSLPGLSHGGTMSDKAVLTMRLGDVSPVMDSGLFCVQVNGVLTENGQPLKAVMNTDAALELARRILDQVQWIGYRVHPGPTMGE
jgi:hypothetical protein